MCNPLVAVIARPPAPLCQHANQGAGPGHRQECSPDELQPLEAEDCQLVGQRPPGGDGDDQRPDVDRLPDVHCPGRGCPGGS